MAPADGSAVDALYALPPEEFVAARDALAKDLRGRKDRAGADAVKALRRPSVPASLVNQLARQEPQQLERLLAVGGRLRKARSADATRSAAAAERELTSALLKAARQLAPDAPTSVFERVRETLHAAVADPETASEVAAGRLERERLFVGFGAGAPLAAGEPPRRAAKSKAPSEKEKKAAAKADAKAKAERKKLDQAIKTAERQVKAAEKVHGTKVGQRKRAEAAEQQAAAALREAQGARDQLLRGRR
jgi:hypothetical protein